MTTTKNRSGATRRGFTLAEVMISMTILSVVMAAAITGTTAIQRSFSAAESYSVGQLAAVDYLTLDLRRSTSYSFTVQGNKLRLPLNLTLPQYYAADGRTPSPGQRTKVTETNRKKRKKHRVFEARFYYHYGSLDGTVPVQYYLANGSLFRKEGSLPAREVGRRIENVTFSSPAALPSSTAAEELVLIETNPVVTTKVEFSATAGSKTKPAPLSNSTFLRQYYYSDL
jgi:prepilin-type N-terminal cleavage/methylation domain-containing protein